MVETLKRMGTPVVGWHQSRAASFCSSPRRAPLGGGAANSCPITEKRRGAHRSCLRPSAMPALLQNGGAQTLGDAKTGHNAHLLRVGEGPLCSAYGEASGDRPKKAQQCDEVFL